MSQFPFWLSLLAVPLLEAFPVIIPVPLVKALRFPFQFSSPFPPCYSFLSGFNCLSSSILHFFLFRFMLRVSIQFLLLSQVPLTLLPLSFHPSGFFPVFFPVSFPVSIVFPVSCYTSLSLLQQMYQSLFQLFFLYPFSYGFLSS